MDGEEKVLDKGYIPRKCDATGSVIHSRDHASIQLNVVKLDENGVLVPNEFETFSIAGKVRKSGLSDDEINRICIKRRIMRSDVRTIGKKRKIFKPSFPSSD